MDFLQALEELKDVVGNSDTSRPIPYWLPTSLPNINIAVSGKADLGFPGGRIITIAGPESSGKTALMTELQAQGQRQGGFAFLEDYEHAFHHGHAKAQGLACDDDSPNWHYKRPLIAEEGFDVAFKIMRQIRASELGFKLPKYDKKDPSAAIREIRKKLVGVDMSKLVPIVGAMDSIASMIPEEQDIAYTDQNMKTKNMAAAMLLSTELKRMARDCGITGTTMILLNQLRNNPGIMFGDSTTEPGGNPPKFYASIMIRLRRTAKWFSTYGDNKTEVIGDVVELYVRKNKVARPFKKTKYVFRTVDPVGLDLIGTMIMLGKEAGVLGPVDGAMMLWDGKKKRIGDFDAECRSSKPLRDELVKFVMGKVEAVVEGPILEDDDDTVGKTGAFAGARPTSIPLVASPPS